MRTICVILLALFLTLPAAAAPTPDNKGLRNACGQAASDLPCLRLGAIPDTVVSGNTSYSNGTYRAEGTVVVASGGRVNVDNATITFGPSSGGFIVQPGGTLVVTGSVLQAAPEGSCFEVLAQPGSILDLLSSTIQGGCGVHVQTTQAQVHQNALSQMAIALRLTETNITVTNNSFANNTVAVNQTGGEPTLQDNSFAGGQVCVQNWLTHPTIVDNLFRGCHVGIHHKRSHSVLSRNDMMDESVPPGGGIVVEETNSPTIEDNVIRHYGTGIIVINARAWIRNNTITENVLDGIRVVNNSGSMEITGNVISDNGDDGIDLQNVFDVLVAANEISGNGANGIRTGLGSRLILEENSVGQNGGHGIQSSTSSVVIEDNAVFDNALTGIRLEVDADSAAVRRNNATGNGQNGFFIAAEDVSLSANVALANAHSGFVASNVSDVAFFEDVALDNAIDGFGIVDVAEAYLNATISTGNARHGYRAFGATGGLLTGVVASDNAQDGYHVNATMLVTLDYVKAFSNGNAGVFNAQGNNTDARNGWYEGNVFAGVANLDSTVWIDARFSYWGSANGPTVPGGDPAGDAVVGPVLYEPYRESPPGVVLLMPIDTVG